MSSIKSQDVLASIFPSLAIHCKITSCILSSDEHIHIGSIEEAQL